MNLYDRLMEIVITEDTTEEYIERRHEEILNESSVVGSIFKTIFGTIAAITIGPYIVMLPVAIIIAIVLKLSGKKKEKIFNQLNNTPEFKSYIDKLIKEIQINLSKETKYSKYLINNSFKSLNNSNADIVKDYTCLVIKDIISYDIEKVWEDKLNMGSGDYNTEHNDNPDYSAPAPKVIKDITKDIKNSIDKINKNTNNKFEIDFGENYREERMTSSKREYLDNEFYYNAWYGTTGSKNGQPINLYIKIENIKEVNDYFKNK